MFHVKQPEPSIQEYVSRETSPEADYGSRNYIRRLYVP